MTPSEIEPATCRFVAQCLNHYATARPQQLYGKSKIHPRTGREDPEGKYTFSCTLSLTLVIDDGMVNATTRLICPRCAPGPSYKCKPEKNNVAAILLFQFIIHVTLSPMITVLLLLLLLLLLYFTTFLPRFRWCCFRTVFSIFIVLAAWLNVCFALVLMRSGVSFKESGELVGWLGQFWTKA